MKISKIMKSYLKSKINEKYPLEVTHIVTGRCNLHCKYCIFPIPTKELSTEEIKKAIREFADAGTLIWTFTGGEPLLRRDIGELVSYAKDCGIPFVHMLTNGLLFKSKVNEIKRLDAITFSLDGPAEIHDKLRGKGTFKKVMEAADLAKKEKINFFFTTVVSKINTSSNFYGIKYVFNLANDLECRVNFQPVLFINNKPGNFYPSKKEFVSIIKFLKNLSRNSDLIKYSERAYDIILKVTNGERVELNCLAGKKFCFLTSEGKVVPEQQHMEEAVDGIKAGFVEAFYQLKHKHSPLCYTFCLPERNIILKFDFYSFIRYVPILIKNRILF